MNDSELKDILEKHLKWTKFEEGGERADLRCADLNYAKLNHANLNYANLNYANLKGALNVYLPISCPEDGEFIGWKKCANDTIVKLKIPADAKRSSATSRKCRASKVIVEAVYDKDDNEIEEAQSRYNEKIIYRRCAIVEPTNGFDENRWNECAPGIHFFITKEEAKRY